MQRIGIYGASRGLGSTLLAAHLYYFLREHGVRCSASSSGFRGGRPLGLARWRCGFNSGTRGDPGSARTPGPALGRRSLQSAPRDRRPAPRPGHLRPLPPVPPPIDKRYTWCCWPKH